MTLPLSTAIHDLKPAIAAAAQSVYDAWDQDADGIDEHYGAGGICDDIASEIAGVLQEHLGIDAMTQHIEIDCHTLVVAAFSDGVFNIDIPPGVYETGTGYVWAKRPDIQFAVTDIVVYRLSPDPADIPQFVDGMDDEPGYAP